MKLQFILVLSIIGPICSNPIGTRPPSTTAQLVNNTLYVYNNDPVTISKFPLAKGSLKSIEQSITSFSPKNISSLYIPSFLPPNISNTSHLYLIGSKDPSTIHNIPKGYTHLISKLNPNDLSVSFDEKLLNDPNDSISFPQYGFSTCLMNKKYGKDKNLVLYGGYIFSKQLNKVAFSNQVLTYNLNTSQWTAKVAEKAPPLADHRTVPLDDSTMVAMGGFTGDPYLPAMINVEKLWKYDINLESWSETITTSSNSSSNLHQLKRHGFSLDLVGNNIILVGGYFRNDTTNSDQPNYHIGILNTVDWKWSWRMLDISVPLTYHASVVVDGQILIVQGQRPNNQTTLLKVLNTDSYQLEDDLKMTVHEAEAESSASTTTSLGWGLGAGGIALMIMATFGGIIYARRKNNERSKYISSLDITQLSAIPPPPDNPPPSPPPYHHSKVEATKIRHWTDIKSPNPVYQTNYEPMQYSKGDVTFESSIEYKTMEESRYSKNKKNGKKKHRKTSSSGWERIPL